MLGSKIVRGKFCLGIINCWCHLISGVNQSWGPLHFFGAKKLWDPSFFWVLKWFGVDKLLGIIDFFRSFIFGGN